MKLNAFCGVVECALLIYLLNIINNNNTGNLYTVQIRNEVTTHAKSAEK